MYLEIRPDADANAEDRSEGDQKDMKSHEEDCIGQEVLGGHSYIYTTFLQLMACNW